MKSQPSGRSRSAPQCTPDPKRKYAPSVKLSESRRSPVRLKSSQAGELKNVLDGNEGGDHPGPRLAGQCRWSQEAQGKEMLAKLKREGILS